MGMSDVFKRKRRCREQISRKLRKVDLLLDEGALRVAVCRHL